MATKTFPVPKEGSSPSKLLGTLYQEWFPFFNLFLAYSFVVYVQAVQEVFVAEEWVKDARNETKVEANLRAKANRALGAAE